MRTLALAIALATLSACGGSGGSDTASPLLGECEPCSAPYFECVEAFNATLTPLELANGVGCNADGGLADCPACLVCDTGLECRGRIVGVEYCLGLTTLDENDCI